MKPFYLAVVAALLATPLLAHGTAHTTAAPEVVPASRSAAEAYYDFEAARAAGYEPLFDCTEAGEDGAMGQHFINTAYATDGQIVVDKPDVLMYEPQPDGAMHLVALEYIVFQNQWTDAEAPQLLGHDLQLKDHVGTHPVDPFYELHVWHWRSNPDGLTADYNTEVSCDYAQ